DSRQALTVTLPCNLRALQLELFDTVSVTLPRFGWSGKAFEVIGWGFTQEGGVKLTLKETDASIFNPDAGFSRSDPAPNTQLPNPFGVPTPTGLELASGNDQLLTLADGTILSRLRVSWAAINDEAVRNGGAVEVRWGPADVAPELWQTEVVPGTDTQVLLQGVQDGRAYVVTIRARNRLVAGEWSIQKLHIVEGKTAPASNVTGLVAAQVLGGVRLSWDSCPDLDYAETEVRLIPAEEVEPPTWTWAGATPLWTGAANDFVYQQPEEGTYTWAVRHRDTSGNMSTATATVTLTTTASGSGLLAVTATAQAFTYDGEGVAAPTSQTISFEAILSGLAGTVTWLAQLFDNSGTLIGPATLTGTGTTRQLTITSFDAAAFCV
ncbi:MAG: hypothetical protein ACK5X3_20250, partial [Pseudomonadota bacterium]